ncbi:MAG: methyltransferase, partial [Oscillospiraceae bacterium]|nr:methyltransferase [Oscillospiraceae bacterium]
METKRRESKMRPGSFSWMCQQPIQPITGRPVTAKENLKRVYDGEVPYWMPVWMNDFQCIWPDVILEHPLYEADGKDWFGAEWVWVEQVGGSMVKPGTRLLSEFLKWREEMKFPDLSKVDFAGDSAYQKEIYDPDRLHLFQSTEGCFERLHEVIPFQEALEALIEEPEEVQAFFEAVADYKIEVIKNVIQYYDPM